MCIQIKHVNLVKIMVSSTNNQVSKVFPKRQTITFDPQNSEAVAQRCSVKKMFLEISQNSQQKNCTRFSLIKLQA